MVRIANRNAKVSRSNVTSIGRAFAKDFQSRTVEALGKTYSESIRDLRSLERRYLTRLEGHPRESLEIRRRIAEEALDQALRHERPLAVCRAKLRRSRTDV